MAQLRTTIATTTATASQIFGPQLRNRNFRKIVAKLWYSRKYKGFFFQNSIFRQQKFLINEKYTILVHYKSKMNPFY